MPLSLYLNKRRSTVVAVAVVAVVVATSWLIFNPRREPKPSSTFIWSKIKQSALRWKMHNNSTFCHRFAVCWYEDELSLSGSSFQRFTTTNKLKLCLIVATWCPLILNPSHETTACHQVNLILQWILPPSESCESCYTLKAGKVHIGIGEKSCFCWSMINDHDWLSNVGQLKKVGRKKGNCTIFDWIGWSCLPNFW